MPAALLWGCSSGRLSEQGVHDPTGIPLSYLYGGARFVVGNLWDVTDRDIDRLSMHFISYLLNDRNTNDASIADALRSARATCKMVHGVGCAPVIYSLPALIT